MYYTATRISATLNFSFKEMVYDLRKDVWMLVVVDNGRNSGVKWEKFLIGYCLETMKDYCSKRFKIPVEDLETHLPRKVDHLFPSFMNKDGSANDRKVTEIFKEVLMKSGLQYQDFQPTHARAAVAI